MPRPVCTIDASSVIALNHLNLLPQLSLLFDRVLLPKGVRAELYRRRITKDRLRAILKSFVFIERCNKYDQASVDVLLSERRTQGLEDRGEAEAVVQAAAVGASVIVADSWGRSLAERSGRELHSTFWVLKRFFELELASPGQTRSHFAALYERSIRLPWPQVNQFLIEIGEKPIEGA
jgi:predicted nucleic acid-binding protein